MARIIEKADTDLQLAVEAWLLNSNIQIRTGRHAGAVAGWLDEAGEPEFAYPEITGYYLSWLAFLAAARPQPRIRRAAREAVEWLGTVTTPERPPATRYYFDGRDDWRNDATFTFDLAMVCRGLNAVRGLVPEQPRKRLLQHFLHYVLRSDNALPVHGNTRRNLPIRWSTLPGPYQLKTAAALLSVVNHPSLWNTYHAWSNRVVEAIDPDNMHASLYAIEGLVQFGLFGRSEAIIEATRCFDSLFSTRTGWAYEPRSDVIAQALRLGCVLQSLGKLTGSRWDCWLSDIRLCLEQFIDDSGAVSFRPRRHGPPHYNAWSAMFAHQALVDWQLVRRLQLVF